MLNVTYSQGWSLCEDADMGMFTILTDKRSFLESLPKFKTVTSTGELKTIVARYNEEGYIHQTSFKTTANCIVVPDVAGWKSGMGMGIQRHLWLFESPMTQQRAKSIRLGNARYIGIHIQYRYHTKKSPLVLTGKFHGDQISAWLHLFAPDRVLTSSAHTLGFFQYTLRE